jgi:solute carrier family 35
MKQELKIKTYTMLCTCLFVAGVLGGVTAYTWNDINFSPIGYLWIAIWYSFATFEMVYVKRVCDTVDMSTWSRSFYQV